VKFTPVVNFIYFMSSFCADILSQKKFKAKL
jgi:hypothetical protein